MESLALPALISLLSAFLVDEAPPAAPPGAETGGLSDAELWRRMVADEDVLAGMTFDAAVVHDPRRVEALVDQRVVNDFYRALAYLHEGASLAFMEQAYLLRNQALRELHGGSVPIEGILDTRRQAWEYYSKVIDVAAKMKRPGVPAETFWQAVVDHQATIRRAFRESAEIAARAALVAPGENEAAAWTEIGAILANMHQVLDTTANGLGLVPSTTPVPLAPPAEIGPAADPVPAGDDVPMAILPVPGPGTEGEGFGLFRSALAVDEEMGSDWGDDQFVQGHRAPGMDLPAYHRAGGRFP